MFLKTCTELERGLDRTGVGGYDLKVVLVKLISYHQSKNLSCDKNFKVCRNQKPSDLIH